MRSDWLKWRETLPFRNHWAGFIVTFEECSLDGDVPIDTSSSLYQQNDLNRNSIYLPPHDFV